MRSTGSPLLDGIIFVPLMAYTVAYVIGLHLLKALPVLIVAGIGAAIWIWG